MILSGVGNHDRGRAVFLGRDLDRVPHLVTAEAVPAQDVVDVNAGEDPWVLLRLLGLDLGDAIGDGLARRFEDMHDIEGAARAHADQHDLHWVGTQALAVRPLRGTDDESVAAARFTTEKGTAASM